MKAQRIIVEGLKVTVDFGGGKTAPRIHPTAEYAAADVSLCKSLFKVEVEHR